MTTQTGERSSLYHPVPAFAGRQSMRALRLAAPAVRPVSVCAAPETSPVSEPATMTKPHCEIDISNPLFIPARRPFCTAAQSVMIFSTAFLGLAASLISLLNQVSGGLQ